jgi:sterol desaturase/sphingolipid hydroxylase (fatty acid hydroxylase superfamily)
MPRRTRSRFRGAAPLYRRRPVPVATAAMVGVRVATSCGEVVTRLSRSPANYWAGFGVDAVGILAFVGVGMRPGVPPAPATCAALLLGGATWTLWEYYVHRFLFHEAGSPFASGHLAHHEAPRDAIGLPFFVAFLLASLLFAGCRLVLPDPYPCFFVAGAYLGWLYYGILHHVEHATDFRFAPYRRLRRHHFVHHGAMSTNFGVSTTFWDRLFGTHSERRRGPARGAQ